MLRSFSHVMMFVQEMDRAVEWYCGTLGFSVVFQAGGHYASLRHAGMAFRLDLHPMPQAGGVISNGPVPNFSVEDIDAAVAELRAKGVKVTDPKREPGSPRFSTFWDSEGNALGLEEPWGKA